MPEIPIGDRGDAAAAAIILSSSSQRPYYASPRHVCDLVRAATLARWLPVVVAESDPGACWWNNEQGPALLSSASYRGTVTWQRSVAGLGDQSTELLYAEDNLTSGNGASAISGFVTLVARSDNAVVEVVYYNAIPPAQQATAAIAITRDVLNRLPSA